MNWFDGNGCRVQQQLGMPGRARAQEGSWLLLGGVIWSLLFSLFHFVGFWEFVL